jgi:predicted MFS family arabinose efflux permease
MFGASAIGGIILTLFLTRGTIAERSGSLMFVCGAALAGTVALLALSPTFAVALVAAALVGAASSGFQMCNQVTLMQRTDPAYFGRVMSLTMTAFGMQMVVGFPAGALADQIGEGNTLLMLAALCAVIVAVGFLSSRARLRGPRPAAENR